jgi:hypothetical protein
MTVSTANGQSYNHLAFDVCTADESLSASVRFKWCRNDSPPDNTAASVTLTNWEFSLWLVGPYLEDVHCDAYHLTAPHGGEGTGNGPAVGMLAGAWGGSVQSSEFSCEHGLHQDDYALSSLLEGPSSTLIYVQANHVPEPATLALLTLVGLVRLSRRR